MYAIFAVPSFSWMLPSAQFLEEFASTFQKDGIKIALPENQSNHYEILALMKQFRYMWWTIIVFIYGCTPFFNCSKNGITISAVHEKRFDHPDKDFEQNHNVLHVTAASTYETKYLNDTMKFLSDKFLKRDDSDNGIWLMGIDIQEGEEDIHTM